jgi:hypothetical protein
VQSFHYIRTNSHLQRESENKSERQKEKESNVETEEQDEERSPNVVHVTLSQPMD